MLTAGEVLGRALRKNDSPGDFDLAPYKIAPGKTVGDSWLDYTRKVRSTLDRIESNGSVGHVPMLIESLRMFGREMENAMDTNGRFSPSDEDVDSAVRAEPRRNSERPRSEIRAELVATMNKARTEYVDLMHRASAVAQSQAMMQKKRKREDEIARFRLTPAALAIRSQLDSCYDRREILLAKNMRKYKPSEEELAERDSLSRRIVELETALDGPERFQQVDQ